MGCSTSSPQQVSHPTHQQNPNSRQNQLSLEEDSRPKFSQENQLDFNCPSGHPLFKVTDKLYKQGNYYCDMCGKNKNVQAEPSAHCSDCEFDICPTCFQAQPDSHYSCTSGHQLYRITSREVVRSGKTYVSNRYVCDLCGRMRNAKDDSTYRCPHCNFDMCPLCYRQQHKTDYYCPSGHHLFKVTDLKTFNDGNAYSNNTYGCHFCRKIFEAEEHPATHCPECRYDVCPDCVRLNFMDPGSLDNLFEQENGSGEENNHDNFKSRKFSKNRAQEFDENNNEIDNKLACVVCLRENRSHIFEPCKHLSTCESCSWMFYNDKKPCPICRREIKNVVKVFIA